jgi:alkanesulfonate monooxygenase SsuD/methylene tetrahydromethanopterin reductase-like flavin-dependent oxidoreductase (luciferase family)
MRFGFVVPYADARDFAEVAALGEQHGWDGVFTWEAVWGVHAWVSLAAASMRTERVRLGTLLTPVARWKPWDLASAVGTVDRLSGGRAILSAGLGAVHGGWTAFEPDEGRRTRVEKLDGRGVRTPGELALLVDQVRSRRDQLGRSGASYDVIIEADSTGEFVALSPPDPEPWAAAGATWWVESWWTLPRTPDGQAELQRRIQAGPPAP